MLSIGLVTDIAFWEFGNGQNARILALYDFLTKHSKLTLYYLGEAPCPFSAVHIHNPSQLSQALAKAEHNRIIVEKLHLDWITDLGLKNTPIYLDAHDLLSERAKAYHQFDRHCCLLTFEEEMHRFSKFDKVILLQKDEADQVRAVLGDRILVCPHPVVAQKKLSLRKKVKTIGFFGGPSEANIDGIHWFHDAVMPLLKNLSQKCTVHGAINYSPFSLFLPRLAKGELFSDVVSCYQNLDIAINPVLYGSGLKIKTVEALAYGIPLVSTGVGVQGLQEESNKSFLLANTAQEFAEVLERLTASFSLREQLSVAAREFAKLHFTPEACFKTLVS